MVSITDCVVEGLKYPFNDVKRVLSFGVLFALINLISLAVTTKFYDIFKVLADLTQKTNTGILSLQYSQLPIADIKFIIGLLIVSFIISLIIMGYEYNVIKFSIEKKEELPNILDILNILVNGIKYFIVSLAYNVIPIILLIVGIVFSADSSVFLIICLISMILFIITFFLLIMALNNMIAYDSIRKAFDFREILDNIANLGYGRYIGIILFTLIVNMIIMVAAGFILSFISVIFAAAINNQALVISSVITLIEGLFVTSYCGVFTNRVYGSIYNESIK